MVLVKIFIGYLEYKNTYAKQNFQNALLYSAQRKLAGDWRDSSGNFQLVVIKLIAAFFKNYLFTWHTLIYYYVYQS